MCFNILKWLGLFCAWYFKVICPEPPDIKHGTREPETSYISVGDVIVYKCKENHQFADKNTLKRVVCYGNGDYSEDITDCQGK